MKLKNKVKMFYTPLGVGVHLEKWGIHWLLNLPIIIPKIVEPIIIQSTIKSSKETWWKNY